ncbi:MAG: hypothetical protein WD512_01900 [Candidatus Paceibacterota bacterium]
MQNANEDPRTYAEVADDVPVEVASLRRCIEMIDLVHATKKVEKKRRLKRYQKENGKAWWDLGTDMISGKKIRGSTQLHCMTCAHTGVSLSEESYQALLEASGEKKVNCPMCQTPIPP